MKFVKGQVPWNKGISWTKGAVSDPTKLQAALRERNLNDNPAKRPEVKEKMRIAKLGKFGEASNRWEGGKVSARKVEMQRDPYKIWRKTVFERDDYTCQECLQKGGKLEADHIKEWSNFSELRYELSNGRTLCHECHKKTPNYGHKAIKRGA